MRFMQPIFILLILGYKLIKQTRYVPLEEMVFTGDGVEKSEIPEEEPQNWWEKFLQMIHMI